ncbi:MAG: sodium:alanine symporter family protein [Nannocystaceae bacterium]|nr:sodium:alanine symporter family protein [Nannocystaceae bacterium]
MERVEELVKTLSHLVWGVGIPVGGETIPWVVVALLGTGVWLTLRLGFIQLRRVGHGIAVASGKYDDPSDPGDVTHFQALTTALSATVGIGNIGGVAIAIHWGGPGALFWTWITAGLGMATKFAEVTLAQHYRQVDKDAGGGGTIAGGPMYYIERGLGPSWKPLAVFFAVALGLTAFLTGDGVQANTVADSVKAMFPVDPWITGAISASVLAAVILGGIQRIGKVTAILAPAMALTYVAAALLVLIIHAGEVLPTFGLIFREAFNPQAGVAGTGVGAFLVTMMWGVKRGLFSNEAGQGSAPIAHAAARTDEPVSEGVVALLEPFIDTILICTMTALVIVITGVWKDRIATEMPLDDGDLTYALQEADGELKDVKEPRDVHVRHGYPSVGGPQLAWHDIPVERLYTDAAHTRPFTGVIDAEGHSAKSKGDDAPITTLHGDAVESGAPLTMLAFRRGLSGIGDFGHYIVLLCVVLFGVSTAISWSYYGDRCVNYVLGKRATVPYKIIFVVMHFVGAVVPLSLIWELGDVLLGVVIVPNLIALVLPTPKIKELVDSYFERKPWKR